VGPPTDLIEAFTAAVPFALREMAGAEAFAASLDSVSPAASELTAEIRLTTADGVWRWVMSFPEQTARNLAQRILAGTVPEIGSEILRDCAGEVANVTAGQAKALLVGSASHFTLSTPITGIASADGAAPEGWVLRFDSDAGDFTTRLSRE
jgi:chemotaxis protein CheX